MQDKNLTDVKNILLRLADHVNAKGIRGLAEFLGISENRLYAWIGRGRIGDTGSILSKVPNIRVEWLKNGVDPMFVDGVVMDAGEKYTRDPIRAAIEHELDKMQPRQLVDILAQCLDLNGEQYEQVKYHSRENREKRIKGE